MLQDDPDNDLYYCRTCTSLTAKSVSIFSSNNSSEPSYNKIVEKVLSVKVDENDSLPHRICLHCAELLFTINDFAQKAIAADTELRKYYTPFATYKDEVDNVNDDASDSDCLPLIHAVNDSNKAPPVVDDHSQEKIINEDLDNKTPREYAEKIFPKGVNNDGPKVYVCAICNKRLMKRYNYERHLKVHSGETLTCPECGKQYRGRSSLDIHVQTIHAQTKNFKCCICTRAFASRTNLQNHYRTHTGERPFGCEQCGLIFRTRSGLTGHLKIHVPEPPLQCAVCGARFRLRCTLVDHLARHADKRYPCPSCNKQFSTKHDLWKHKQIHRADRTYGCPDCQATFNVRRYLSVHLKTHAAKDASS